MGGHLSLTDGSRVAVIGGGPAGSFFVHFIQKFAAQKGIELSVTIFDGKDFLQPGPLGCNLCAGVIAESLNDKLKEEGIFLPEKRIINRVDGYCLHVGGDHLHLSCAENQKYSIATVFRGNGPRYSSFPEIISFDDFLLSWARDRGAEVISQPVWNIEFAEDKPSPLTIHFGEKSNLQEFEADLVVGAFGVNTFLLKKIQNLNAGYRPPSTLITYQAEVKLGRANVWEHFGNTIHVYMSKSRTLRYATVIPKGDYITITLIGKKDATKNIYPEFLSLSEIREKIPSFRPQCFCFPRIAVSPSKKPFGHRLVIIGDASFSRHYKNGLESAFLTAKLAAETALYHGVDSDSLSGYYYRKAKKHIINDNYYGRFLFFLNDVISSSSLLSQSHLSLAKDGKRASKKLRSMLWNMFAGNIPYKEIFRISLDLKLQIALLKKIASLIFQKVKATCASLGKTSIDAIILFFLWSGI